MKEVKICFNKKDWAEDGTFYRGTFTITEDIYNKYLKYLESNSDKIDDILKRAYAKSKVRVTDNKKFMNLTQKSMFINFMTENNIKFNTGRASLNYNYYLLVK